MGDMADFEIDRMENSIEVMYNTASKKIELVPGIDIMYGKSEHLKFLEDVAKEVLIVNVIADYSKEDIDSIVRMFAIRR